jgi:hypothetical protein
MNLKPKKDSINPFPNSKVLKSPKNNKPKDELLKKKPKNKLLEINTTKLKIGNIIHFPAPLREQEDSGNISQESFKPYGRPNSPVKKSPANKKNSNQYKVGAGNISGWQIKNITSGSFFN